MESGELKLRLNSEELRFNVYKYMKNTQHISVVSAIVTNDDDDDGVIKLHTEEHFSVQSLTC